MYGTARRQLDTCGLSTHMSVDFYTRLHVRVQPSKYTVTGNHTGSFQPSTDLHLGM